MITLKEFRYSNIQGGGKNWNRPRAKCFGHNICKDGAYHFPSIATKIIEDTNNAIVFESQSNRIYKIESFDGNRIEILNKIYADIARKDFAIV